MKIKNKIYTVLLSFVCFYGIAQESVLHKAEEEYNQYAYIDAISIYEKAAENGYQDEKMFQRLGNAYYFNAELTKAVKWYDALFTLNSEQQAEYYYRYAQALKAVGDYTKSNKMLETFNMKAKSDTKGISFNKNYLEQIKANSGRYEVSDAGINSEQSDYGSTLLHNKLVFTSARDTGTVFKKIFKWTNRYFTNLYIADLKPDGSAEHPIQFRKTINSKFNESTPVFTKDGNTMYFTRNNFVNGKKGKSDKRITLLKLYKADFVKGKWTNIVELPFNSNQYSVAHAALSLDEKTLYFASDMPGSFGESDLFRVAIKEDGTYGTPENLGPEVNTQGHETFPFISADNELYFASDAHPGLGGLDIFVTKIKEDHTLDIVQNIGEPINTRFDDFAFMIDTSTRKGFFSSNKKGTKGNDNIYKFTETKMLCEKKLSGTVKDLKTNKVLGGTKIILFDNTFHQIAEVISEKDGTYNFDVKCNTAYHVRALKKDYETVESKITIASSTEKTVLDIKLEKQIREIGIGTDLAKTLDIPTIYFDLDKSFIRKYDTFELEKVVAVMKQYPKMKIEVRSHTDSRESEEYNMVLSNKRAKTTIEWLIKKGIAPNRLTGKGYGESRLINKCADNVPCTEEEHELNRRSEFIILSVN